MKLFTKVLVCLMAIGVLTSAFAGCAKKAEEGGKTTPTTEKAKQ
jgi:hypothetical protein